MSVSRPPRLTPSPRSRILPPVSKKPSKVGEPQASYAAKKPAKAAPATKRAVASDADFKRITDKLFTERKELLHKLAQ